MNRKGILVVVSGFSGVGKGTLMKLLTERYGQYALSISATTRSPRVGEEDGREYFFRTREAFEELIANDQLVEYAEYCGNYYGTPREYVESQMEQGRDVILEIELQGALKIKKKFPKALLLFIVPPDAKTLLDRLRGRNTETEDVIQKRLARAAEESEGIEQYDYIIVNDDLDTCVKQVHELIQSAHCKKSHNTAFIKELQQDMNCFLKGE